MTKTNSGRRRQDGSSRARREPLESVRTSYPQPKRLVSGLASTWASRQPMQLGFPLVRFVKVKPRFRSPAASRPASAFERKNPIPVCVCVCVCVCARACVCVLHKDFSSSVSPPPYHLSPTCQARLTSTGHKELPTG